MEAAHYEQTELWGDGHVFNPEHQLPKFAAVKDLLGTRMPSSLVDVGAGDGRVLRYLADSGVDGFMVGAERSWAAITHLGGVGVQSSIDSLPFADRSFAVAICTEVLEHLPPAVFDQARAELSRLARDTVIVTVPNRERRSRSDVTCSACGCRYNPDRHLRSFSPDQLDSLLDGFAVEQVIETGPHQPIYPRWARVLLERAGLLQRPGSPSCPQCGTMYRFAAHNAGERPASSADGSAVTTNGDRSLGRRGYHVARRLIPKARHPYYLCARFRRIP